ncbi:MAG: heavy metal translocating P-type ATPase [bacterium]
MQYKFNITGMTCSACSSRVDKAVNTLSGIETLNVNLLTNSMQVSFDEEKLSCEDIIKAVKDVGYGASLVNSNTKTSINTNSTSDIITDEFNDFILRLKVSFLFLVPLMYISMGHMMGMPLPAFLKGHSNAIAFSFSQFLLTIPICYVNRSYFFNGFKALFKKNPNMDSLIAIGSTASLFYGIFAIYRIGYGLGNSDMELISRYHMDLYFESCATILSLITLGKFFEAKSKGKTSEALKKLIDLAPKTALVEINGEVLEKDCSEIIVGDIVIIKPGTSVPIDGEIIFGSTFIDQSAITGESIPVEKNIGDKVIGATINKNGFIKVRASKVSSETIFSQIVELVENASSSKAPIAKLADKISGIFVPIVITISILTGIVWLLMGYTFEMSLSFAITVLVISCPCALGLATPVAIMVGTGKGAENGILIKSGEALETAHNLNTIILDKTGTITKGQPQVTDIIVLDSSVNNTRLLEIASSLEKQSEHPLGRAIYDYSKSQNIEELEINNFRAVLGRGVMGVCDNVLYMGGNEALLKENFKDFLSNANYKAYKNKIDELASQGKAPLIFASEDKLLGIIAVADEIKEGSKQAILDLKNLGLEVLMVTGDNKKTANFIAKELLLDDVIAEVLPQDKELIVKKYQEQGKKVAMVGDGINDAPALISANVGISMANGTDIAIESGDIILMNDDLNSVVTSIRLSKRVIKNIKQNLFWAFFYNCLGIPLACGIFYLPFGIKLTPMFGAFAMSISSIFVVLNALRLKDFKSNITLSNNNSDDINNNIIIKENDKMINLNIEGMMCMHCVNHVKKALLEVNEISEVEVDLDKKQAVVNGDINNNTLLDNLKIAIEEAGYKLVSYN